MNGISKNNQTFSSDADIEDLILELDGQSRVQTQTERQRNPEDYPSAHLKKERFQMKSALTPSHIKSLSTTQTFASTLHTCDDNRAFLENLRKSRNKKQLITRFKEAQGSIPIDSQESNMFEQTHQTTLKSERPTLRHLESQKTDGNVPMVSLSKVDYSGFEYDLQTRIDEAEENEEVLLPERTIRVADLVIRKPITIIGSTKSVLEITNSIVVNLGKSTSGQSSRVLFSECVLSFEYKGVKSVSHIQQEILLQRHKEGIEQKYLENQALLGDIIENKSLARLVTENNHSTEKNRLDSSNGDKKIALFTIHSNSILELQDCKIASKTMDNSSQDVCFYLKHDPKAVQLPTLIAQSTFITNFNAVVENNNLAGVVNLEKLFVSNSRTSAINLSNPTIVEIKECMIENTQKSGVNIRYSKESESNIERSVTIAKNEFAKGQSYGISIFGENIHQQKCLVNIKENKILEFLKDGIAIKNLNIQGIHIEGNQITKNNGNGILIQNVVDTRTHSQVRLSNNKISHSKLYGIVLIDSSIYSEEEEYTANQKGGVLMSCGERIQTTREMNFYKTYPLRNIFNSTKIVDNHDSGIIILGALKGPFLMSNCEVSGNTNGLYIKQEQIKTREKSSSQNQGDPPGSLGEIVLDRCGILHNTLSGIYVRNLNNKLYIKQTTIYSNKNYAIYIENQEEAQKIEFSDSKKDKGNRFVSGPVGGKWGLLYEKKSQGCQPLKCMIF